MSCMVYPLLIQARLEFENAWQIQIHNNKFQMVRCWDMNMEDSQRTSSLGTRLHVGGLLLLYIKKWNIRPVYKQSRPVIKLLNYRNK